MALDHNEYAKCNLWQLVSLFERVSTGEGG